MSLFDDLVESGSNKTNLKPYHSIKDKGEKEHLNWLNEVTETLQKQAVSRTKVQRGNLEAYRGVSTSGLPVRRSESLKFNKSSKFVINHLYDIVETKVSQMCRMKPAVDILPTNDEFEDKNAANAVKMLINHLWYMNDIDAIMQKIQRQSRIFGEAYLFIEWDKDLGDIHPKVVEAKSKGIDLELMNEEGQVVVDEEGNAKKIDLDLPIKIGDIKYKIETPWRVFLQRRKKFEDVEYAIKVNVTPVEDLKKDYPQFKDQIKSETKVKLYDQEDLTDRLLEEEVLVYEFFHKQVKNCRKGAYVKYTKDVILEESVLPYSHGELPFERLTDIDVPEQLNGVSGFDLIKPIQNMHNNLSTLLAKNIYLTGHAKWVMPRGACKIEALGNDSTIVQYQGPVAPQLMQTAPNPREAYTFRDMLVQEMGQVYGVQGVSRGTPPKGITAGVALQFLNEQEQERSTTDVSKHNNFVQKIARKTIAVAGDYYAPDDGRMLRIVGKDNKYSIRHFDSANLSKDYDVRVQVGTALPESKAGKMQRIIEIMQMKPDLLSNERWIDLLEFGNVDKMNTLLTVAVKCAESENEDLLAGKYVGEPMEWEDHIVHWRTHVRAMQSRSFKEETPLEVQKSIVDHIAVTEFAMTEKAQSNPNYEAKLAELPNFPIFPAGFIPQSREQQEIVVQGQANRGDTVTGIIPGKETEEGKPFSEGEK